MAETRVAERPSAADAFALAIVRGSKSFVVNHPVLSFSWVLGLVLSLLATGFTPPPEALNTYNKKLDDLEGWSESLVKAEEHMWRTEMTYRRSKGWFSCDQLCRMNKKDYELARSHFQQLNTEYTAGIRDAKSHLGVFSDHGVGQAKDLFWSRLAGGRDFAKRATFYSAIRSALFVGMRRDQSLSEYLLQLFFNFIVNLTMGLIGALVTFLFSIWSVIWEYQPDPISATAFFLACALGAFSVVATWLLGLCAVTAGGVYGVVKAAEVSRLEAERNGGGHGGGGGAGRPPPTRRIHYD
ncbi:unnamed protein product [Phaeothamnion confervicola]